MAKIKDADIDFRNMVISIQKAARSHNRTHIVSSGRGWKVINEGAKRAVGIYPSKDEAIASARKIVSASKSNSASKTKIIRNKTIIIHRLDGSVEDMRTYK